MSYKPTDIRIILINLVVLIKKNVCIIYPYNKTIDDFGFQLIPQFINTRDLIITSVIIRTLGLMAEVIIRSLGLINRGINLIQSH